MIHRRLIAKGIKYYLTLPHHTGHGIHSPFLFRMIHEVFAKDISYDVERKIENYRQNLIIRSDKITVSDFGAKGKGEPKFKRVKEIALNESISCHYGKLIYNLISEYKPEKMIELGTCLGMGSLYMALANPGGMVYTMEGSPAKADLASNMLQGNVSNVEIIKGNFDDKLAKVLLKAGSVDFAFIDGNHKKESTLKYFEEILVYSHSNTIIILDDINWSPGMMEAWTLIQNHKQTRVCLDLFRVGIVLLDPKLQKENFTIFY